MRAGPASAKKVPKCSVEWALQQADSPRCGLAAKLDQQELS